MAVVEKNAKLNYTSSKFHSSFIIHHLSFPHYIVLKYNLFLLHLYFVDLTQQQMQAMKMCSFPLHTLQS
jgi:hypothetical protein